jgi:lipoic acid synthetase
VRTLGLRYVVVTSVTRDDLPDEGARQFAGTVGAIRSFSPGTKIEVLIPDFSARRDLLELLLAARPDVVGHNIETVRRLSPVLRSGADHARSLKTLALVRDIAPEALVKSGFMVGLGETDEEIGETFDELKAAGCDIVTVGQYLAPTKSERHVPVARFVPPETFGMYRKEGLRRGLGFVMAGPLVRSSYLAEQGYEGCLTFKEGMLE